MSIHKLSFLPLAAVLAMPLMTAACGVPLAVTAASYGADGVSLATTRKTSTDHFVSMVSKRDCAMWRMFRNRPMCKDREDGHDPYDVDYDTPERTESEGGVQYLAPPHAAVNAPAVSWDVSAYKPVPMPLPPAEPVTAVADGGWPTTEPASPTAPVAAAKPTPVHPKKTAHSGKPKRVKPKTPSPDQAAVRL